MCVHFLQFYGQSSSLLYHIYLYSLCNITSTNMTTAFYLLQLFFYLFIKRYRSMVVKEKLALLPVIIVLFYIQHMLFEIISKT